MAEKLGNLSKAFKVSEIILKVEKSARKVLKALKPVTGVHCYWR